MINYETIVQPQEFTVEQIFNNNEYLIPIYQRNYAWSSVEIEQLLDDINDIDIKESKTTLLNDYSYNKLDVFYKGVDNNINENIDKTTFVYAA